MTKYDDLAQQLRVEFADFIVSLTVIRNEVTLECNVEQLTHILSQLRDNEIFACNQLIDLCAVDYLHYGLFDWETESTTESGFSRGVARQEFTSSTIEKPRFAVAYHLLSTIKNHRIRVKVFLEEQHLVIPSVHNIWKVADWFEREAYDLYGILFTGHPDLRRLLTDYGFIGHPFRKDFPQNGYVEMRNDATLEQVIYVPVDIQPRTTVPKVIRKDNRYLQGEKVS